MNTPTAGLVGIVLVGLAVIGGAGCGSDEPAGPQLGDLAFLPDTITLGSKRDTTILLTNRSSASLGPIVLGRGAPMRIPGNEVCGGLRAIVSPGTVSSLPGGGSVSIELSFDFAGLGESECPLGTYEVAINAAVDAKILAAAVARLDHLSVE